jgi:hypothetical protein
VIKNIGVWLFRVITSGMPVLTILESQLQQHSFDVWALGSGIVGTVIVVALHYNQAQSDPISIAVPPAVPTSTTPPSTIASMTIDGGSVSTGTLSTGETSTVEGNSTSTSATLPPA